MLSPETAIYHTTTRKAYEAFYNKKKERYLFQHPEDQRRPQVRLVTQTDLRDAIERARKLARRQGSSPLLLIIDSTKRITSDLVMQRSRQLERGIVYTLQSVPRDAYMTYHFSENGTTAGEEAQKINRLLRASRRK